MAFFIVYFKNSPLPLRKAFFPPRKQSYQPIHLEDICQGITFNIFSPFTLWFRSESWEPLVGLFLAMVSSMARAEQDFNGYLLRLVNYESITPPTHTHTIKSHWFLSGECKWIRGIGNDQWLCRNIKYAQSLPTYPGWGAGRV